MLTALFINNKRTRFNFLANRLQSEIVSFISCQFHCHPNVTTNDLKAPQIGLTPHGYCIKISLVENKLLDTFFEKNMKIRDSHNFCKKR